MPQFSWKGFLRYYDAISPEASRLQLMSSSADRISAKIPDWTREKPRGFWDPGRKLLASIRGYQRWCGRTGLVALLTRKLYVFRYRIWSVVTGTDIPLNCQIGGGLLLPHPNGIVIHPDAKIGVNCLIFHQVTIGTGNRSGLPTIGGHVDFGAGAKVLGPITIGDHAAIGANAVVTKNVGEGETVVGYNIQTGSKRSMLS
jgi:serine O-acetyltransferase